MQFARVLVGEMKSAMRLHRKPLKSAGFKVLKSPDVPSVLVELGYVSNKADLKLLTSEAWRAKAAADMAQAVEQFFRHPARRYRGRRGPALAKYWKKSCGNNELGR